jgi:hypothetical protein
MQTPPRAKDRRRVGLALLLAGLVLTIGGLALPWVSVSCIATCQTFSADYAATRGPIETFGASLFAWLSPAWVLVVIVALLVARQEVRPIDRRSAVPVLLLALILLLVQAFIFVLLRFYLHFAATPLLVFGLLPGGAVSPIGTVLVAVGGWLRYHPRRGETPGELAQFSKVPAER